MFDGLNVLEKDVVKFNKTLLNVIVCQNTWYIYKLWNSTQTNTTQPHWWLVNIQVMVLCFQATNHYLNKVDMVL